MEIPIPHRVTMLAFPDGQMLDVVGPLEVFSRAARWLRDEGYTRDLAYRVEVVAEKPGPVRMSSGLEIIAARSFEDVRLSDTLMVSGGIGYPAVCDNPFLLQWLRKQKPRVERLASICNGALILGKAGLLDGLTATTHWEYCDELSAISPDVTVDRDALFVRQGNLYTSAGVTAGMDLALALVEEDWGRKVALAVAQELVLFIKRPGGQSQFSSFIQAQALESDRFRDLQLWILSHLESDLSVQALADRVAMSPRNFARAFLCETGETPGRYVRRMRIEAARRELEESQRSVEQIAQRCGFGSPETMRRGFVEHLRVSPSDYRARFQSDLT
ncbi:MAG: GlxA family transcriptional regulator [Xanthomonadales bacterium]|nr:GlxA family transcriptional regulator [Xanthomonadales bacterium]NNL95530.1 GlxA family transcriptional regulator [Xanthomonadales bacterium]